MLKVIISSAFAFFLVGATALAANTPKKPTGNSGLASVYSHGRTASGERLIPTTLTGAPVRVVGMSRSPLAVRPWE